MSPLAGRTASGQLLAEGRSLHLAGSLDEAEACYRKFLADAPMHPEANQLMGLAASAGGRHAEAIACLGRAVRAAPAHAGFRSDLGLVLDAAGRPGEALAAHREAVALVPDGAAPLNNLGVALRAAGLAREAAVHLRRAAAAAPEVPEVHVNLANALADLREFDAAEAALRAAVRLRPGMAQAHSDLGNVLREAGSCDAALEAGLYSVSLDPSRAESLNNVGVTLARLGRTAEAASCYRRALALSPAYPDAHANLGMALLARGEDVEGWREFEWRWRTPAMARHVRAFGEPHWRGEPGEGRSLLIHAEQGFGDTIQFCRLAAVAALRGWQVVLEVQPALVRLLASLPFGARVVAQGDPLPRFDAHCPMLGLPAAIGLRGCPPGAPYLRPDPLMAAAWARRLAAGATGAPLVGVAWAGNPDLPRDAERSLPEWALRRLLEVPGISFVSLQRDVRPPAGCAGMADPLRDAEDFAAAAAVVAGLDLVVSVDTAVAHLAGAMGVPVFLLDRFAHCWRWPEGSSSTPWYPSMTILRQPAPDSWEGPLAAASASLRVVRPPPRGLHPGAGAASPVIARDLALPPASMTPMRRHGEPEGGGPPIPCRNIAKAAPPMAHHVLSFVGQNENGILSWWTQQIHGRLAQLGASAVLIDMLSPTWQEDVVSEVNRKRPTFGFSFQGYGTGVMADGRNVWDLLDIPVICSMGDAPYHAPPLHRASSKRQILLYSCQDFLDAYRTYMGGPSFAAVVPFGFPENPLADATPWDRRGQGVVYVKSGNDPMAQARQWMQAPVRIRAILHDAASVALSGSPVTIADLCAASFHAHGIHWGHRREAFLRVCSEVDMFVRATRAERMAQHLMQRPDAVIFGRWPHLDRTQARATFRDPVHASTLHALYADTKVLVNTMPSVRTGVHERIISGLLSRCAVLSDTNPGLQAELDHLPSLALVDLDRADYPARIDAALDAQLGGPPDLEAAYLHAVKAMSTDAFLGQALQFLEVDAFSQESANWRLDA